MTTFEDNLFDDLMAAHGDELAAARPAPRRTRSRQLVAAGAAVAVIGAGVIGFSVATTTPAYAVTRNADGTVTVRISDIAAIDPANAALREMGVRAVAVRTGTRADTGCTGEAGLGTSDDVRFGPDWSVRQPGDGSVVVSSSGVHDGYAILLTVSPYPDRGDGLGFISPRKLPAPACLLDPADDPGAH